MNDQKGNEVFRFSYALSLAFQLGFLIVASIVGFLALGYWLDTIFHTDPLFLMGGILTGVIVTILEVGHLIKPLIADKDPTSTNDISSSKDLEADDNNTMVDKMRN
jgi:F0F1-type ATP synthase assembly protein I